MSEGILGLGGGVEGVALDLVVYKLHPKTVVESRIMAEEASELVKRFFQERRGKYA